MADDAAAAELSEPTTAADRAPPRRCGADRLVLVVASTGLVGWAR